MNTAQAITALKQFCPAAGAAEGNITHKQTAVSAILPFLIFLVFCTESYAQSGVANDTLRGVVVEQDAQGVFQPLPMAHVYWLGTQRGTTTNTMGAFILPAHPETRQLVVSYTGYDPDTLFIRDYRNIQVVLRIQDRFGLVEVTEQRAPSFIARAEARNTRVITEGELFKAACCNLSESFETNPSVEVTYTDAASGVKQIQLLGLSGAYVQLLKENLPGIRGLATHYGLALLPGSWIDEMQLTQGAGSVVNGYESLTGQINLEVKKPDYPGRVMLNAYQNQMGRSEANLVFAQPLSNRWNSSLLLHANKMEGKPDINNDGFVDLPAGRQWNGLLRLHYNDGQGLTGQIAFRGVDDRRRGGQVSYLHDLDRNEQAGVYGLKTGIGQQEVFGKIGYVFPAHKYRSIGFLWNASATQLDNQFGQRDYHGAQHTRSAQLIYQDIVGDTRNRYRAGLSWLNDRYTERIDSLAISSNAPPVPEDSSRLDFVRHERVPGVFTELTLERGKHLWVLGLRYDRHNLYGGQWCPRLNWKWNISDNNQLRFSTGRGFRVASVLAEQQGGLVSGRRLIIDRQNERGAFGLNAERAWHVGLHGNHDFRFRYRSARVSMDVQQTWFTGQVVADYDQSPTELHLYSLDGTSFSRSAQLEVEVQPRKRMELRLAYRLQDVQTDYRGGRLTRPLVPRSRGLMNLSWKTKSRWDFDFTLHTYGSKRLPSTKANPDSLRMRSMSPVYAVGFFQLTKNFDRSSFYLGIENLTDFRQTDLIISPQQPFSPYFDASLVWGPAIERMIYVGWRWRLIPAM
jgi:hypothetical protein